ncbi:hypothetical protein ACFRAR_08100 [Kitasatospora sp. NPDC056651]|uniref:hypothetical protein n=1 Tax=Kitasatospora sp. NPDC056651 TaxID=3345892 RepID=UPI0036B786C7
MERSVSRLLASACAEPSGPSLAAVSWRPPTEEDPAAAAARLAAVTAARLGLRHPPLGEPRPPGAEVLLLAAALTRPDPVARAARLVNEVRATAGGAELLARHGLVSWALSPASGLRLDPELADLLVARSPLTEVLTHPRPHRADECGALLDRLLLRPDTRRLVVRTLAEPEPDSAATVGWRADVLEGHRRTTEGRHLVLDVYETALLRHGPRTLRLVRDADGLLRAGDDPWARALCAWWGPLAWIHRNRVVELRARPLLVDHRPGIGLFRRHSTGGVPR